MYQETLGLVGFGVIAKSVARRAKGFVMHVHIYDLFVTEIPKTFQEYVTIVELDKLVCESDIVSIHVPLTDETRNLFDKKRILSMKQEAFLINISRGGIINKVLPTFTKVGREWGKTPL